MTNQSYKRQNSHQLSLWRRDGGQSDENQNKQQQQQPANHSPNNAKIVRCFSPFSHPGPMVLEMWNKHSYTTRDTCWTMDDYQNLNIE